MNLFKFKCTFLFIISAFVLSLTSCKTTKNAELAYKPLDKSLLWQITGPGVKRPSFLYGTIHIIDGKDYFLPKGTMAAFDAAKKVVFEIDMKEMSDISALMGMMNKIFMKDNKTLKDLVTSDEYKMIGDHFQKMGLPIFMLERMKPMFLTVFASGDMDPSGLKNGNMKSYEMEFLEMANNTGKETGGLESIDFQIGLFDEIPYEAQAKMLVDAIKASDVEGNDELKKMVDIYKSQDVHAMSTMISEEGSEVAGFEDKLLTQRNIKWIPQIIEAARNEATFFAVGAGHLGGKEGVIHLLRKEGMKVTPVK
ncbi:MAG: TraB/GumN family protein [Saprospiraceae bacterium]|nr:TraB/GumN family protein [Saprospiraceae bacterium]MBK8670323.1 TraB/GumN family protein [Saprospiraceae bacterium]MBL0099159.1 TraB/GumN family protein [Saprospiraceae bacterium]